MCAVPAVHAESGRMPPLQWNGPCSSPGKVLTRGQIRDALLSAQKIEMPEGAKINLYVVAAPKYAVEVQAEDYKEAEKILQSAADTAIKAITKAGGSGAFQRIR